MPVENFTRTRNTPMSNDDDNDHDLFQQMMKGVRPLKQERVSQGRKPGPIRRRPAETHKGAEDVLSDGFLNNPEQLNEFMRPGVQKSLLKQIRNGKLPVDASLDLHGHTREEARRRLQDFIYASQQQQMRLVCVVHGKGYHSEDNRPVLKQMVSHWLQQLEAVLAFTRADPGHGGSGATFVLLRRPREE